MKYRLVKGTFNKFADTKFNFNDFDLYELLMPSAYDSTVWQPIVPPIGNNSSFKWKDPNELNKEHNLPPYYAVLPKKGNPKKWIEDSFKSVKYLLESYNDIMFDGSFKGYENTTTTTKSSEVPIGQAKS